MVRPILVLAVLLLLAGAFAHSKNVREQIPAGLVEIAGTVVDAGGGPVAGAWVVLTPYQTWTESMDPCVTLSGPDGKFRFVDVEDVRWSIAARRDGYREGHDAFVPDRDAGDRIVHVIHVRRESNRGPDGAGRITGQVLSGDERRPCDRFAVSVTELDQVVRRKRTWRVRFQGTGGRFLFGALMDGRHRIFAEAVGVGCSAPREVTLRQGVGNLRPYLVLDASATIECMVIRPDGRPAYAPEILIRRLDGIEPRAGPSRGPWREQGRVTMREVSPGEYGIRAAAWSWLRPCSPRTASSRGCAAT